MLGLEWFDGGLIYDGFLVALVFIHVSFGVAFFYQPLHYLGMSEMSNHPDLSS